MGYRYKNGGWSPRMYEAFVIVNERLKTVRYSSIFAKNSNGNFYDLQKKAKMTFGVEIDRGDVIDVELLSLREGV